MSLLNGQPEPPPEPMPEPEPGPPEPGPGPAPVPTVRESDNSLRAAPLSLEDEKSAALQTEITQDAIAKAEHHAIVAHERGRGVTSDPSRWSKI